MNPSVYQRVDLSTLFGKFVIGGITPSTIWNTTEEDLLGMKMVDDDIIKFQEAKTEGKYCNTSEL